MGQTNRPTAAPDRHHRREGFTIIEMLVVVAIVALIVAILLPAIAGVRRSAGKSKTLTTITDLTQASQAFLTDNRRLPGYFTAEEMGDPDNNRRGFPAMANILLELSGGFVAPGDAVPSGLTAISNVGPVASNTITVLPERIGSDEGQSLYYTPDPKALKMQDSNGAMTALDSHKAFPHMVDAFGTPLLAWAESDTIAPDAEFAAIDNGGGSTPARFYWNTNLAFLGRNATLVGRQAADEYTKSLLGGSHPDTDRIETMAALLGHPSYPDSQTPPAPASSRGSLVFHSAGPNGLYIGDSEQAAKSAGGDKLTYTGKDDPMRRCDDVIRALGQ